MPIEFLKKQFSAIFPDAAAPTVAARAPGRVNLIGEHTDYNDGLVCPMALDRSTLVLAAPRKDATVRIHSILTNESVEFSIADEVAKGGKPWSLYPKGAAEAMRQRAGVTLGMDALVASDVPLGSGLSSSAAIEVSTSLALLAINQKKMDPVELALACQWAENTYPNMPCGIMDQFISVMGEKGHALLIDCRDRTTTQVPLDDPDLRVVISNSNVEHKLVAGEYQARRNQCETAVSIISKRFLAVKSLRDATLGMLEDSRLGMDPVIYKRAHHVITEIHRTNRFAHLLAKRDYAACGTLMYASHASLRDDYAVSCPELDSLVHIASNVTGVIGARMTGGGFGGCIVALCKANAVDPLTEAIESDYPRRAHGLRATTFSTIPSQGAHLEEVK